MKKSIKEWLSLDVLTFALCVGFFILLPNFDVQISSLFFEQDRGFYLNTAAWAEFIYTATDIVGRSLVVALIGWFIVAMVFPKSALSRGRRKKLSVYFLACALLGPVFITDTVLKKSWDRPRPSQAQVFGGDYPFEPPFAPTFACDGCESFVSGHAAAGFFLLSVVALQRPRTRRRALWLGGAFALGAVVSGTRIAQGGHFLSDVIFSGYVVWFSARLVQWMVFGGDRTQSSTSEDK